MPNEGYRKRLDEWEKTQKRMKDQEVKETPYDPWKMRSRAPWGCIIMTLVFAGAVVYTLGALAGYWKNIFFKG